MVSDVPRENGRFLPRRITGKPARRGLAMDAKDVIHAMVHGTFADIEFEGPRGKQLFRAFEPMTFMDACQVLGRDPRAILPLTEKRQFTEEMLKQLNARRCLEQTRNLAVAIGLRDDPGDGSAMAAAVRLKAVMAIDRAYAAANPAPHVQINNIQQNNEPGGQAKPGYVIRLRPVQKTIEHQK